MSDRFDYIIPRYVMSKHSMNGRWVVYDRGNQGACSTWSTSAEAMLETAQMNLKIAKLAVKMSESVEGERQYE